MAEHKLQLFEERMRSGKYLDQRKMKLNKKLRILCDRLSWLYRLHCTLRKMNNWKLAGNVATRGR
jgi:hypothetical protein